MSADRVLTSEIPVATRVGTGAYRQNPADLVTNGVLAPTIATKSGNPIDNNFIIARTRVRERFHVKTADAVAKMGSDALSRALKRKMWDLSNPDYLIVATSWETQKSTADAIIDLQTESAKPGKTPQLLHTIAACASFTQTLHELHRQRARFEGKNIAIVATEQYSTHTESLDDAIFGDHAAAFVGKFGKDLDSDFDILGSSSIPYLDKSNKIRMRVSKPSPRVAEQLLYFQELPFPQNVDDPDFVMDGPSVFEYALGSDNFASVESALKEARLKLEDIDFIDTHQANGRITESLYKRLKQKGFKGTMPSNIEYFGNTSSVSIPLLLDEFQPKSGQKAVLWGFGAGLLTCSVVVLFR